MSDKRKEVQDQRVSFRTTTRHRDKLVSVATSRGWCNADGEPNLSTVLNHMIDSFKSSKKEKPRGR